MMRDRILFWAAALGGGLSGFFFLLALAWRQWIEVIFSVDPDRHSGSLEWLIPAALFAAAVTFGCLARHQWRRIAPAG
jgi:hypothetical protein